MILTESSSLNDVLIHESPKTEQLYKTTTVPWNEVVHIANFVLSWNLLEYCFASSNDGNEKEKSAFREEMFGILSAQLFGNSITKWNGREINVLRCLVDQLVVIIIL